MLMRGMSHLDISNFESGGVHSGTRGGLEIRYIPVLVGVSEDERAP